MRHVSAMIHILMCCGRSPDAQTRVSGLPVTNAGYSERVITTNYVVRPHGRTRSHLIMAFHFHAAGSLGPESCVSSKQSLPQVCPLLHQSQQHFC